MLDTAEFGKVIATYRLDRYTRLDLRHRWVFRDEFAALMISDDHGCRSEILIPTSLLHDLRDQMRWIQ